MTEWRHFRNPDFGEMKARMRGNGIVDARSIWTMFGLARAGVRIQSDRHEVTMRGWLAAAAAAVVLTAFAPRASAQEYYYTEYERQWYGWQTLAIDVPSLTAFTLAQGSGKNALGYGFPGVFVVGAPVVHLVHENNSRAALSGGGRLLLPLMGIGLVRPLLDSVAPHSSVDTRGAASIAIPSFGIVVIDALLLAYDEKETRVPIEQGG